MYIIRDLLVRGDKYPDTLLRGVRVRRNLLESTLNHIFKPIEAIIKKKYSYSVAEILDDSCFDDTKVNSKFHF